MEGAPRTNECLPRRHHRNVRRSHAGEIRAKCDRSCRIGARSFVIAAESGPRGHAPSGRVYVLEAGEPKARDVHLGLTDGSSTEVVGGLAEGTEVIVGVADARGTASQPSGGGLPRTRLF